MDNEIQGPGGSSLDGEEPTIVQQPPEPGMAQTPAPVSGNHHLPLSRLLLFSGGVLLLIILALLVFVLFKKPAPKTTTKQPVPITINTQTLDNGTLNKLTAQAGPSGETKQQLTITPDTLFKNDLEVQGNARVGKDLFVGGNLNVRGTTTLQGAVGINSNLAVRGALSVGGALTAPSLNVGSLGVTNINASGSLSFGGHLIPSGNTPSIKASVATTGGTATISGNDTAGTIIINIGNGTMHSGELAIITFIKSFTLVPHVQLTPINQGASAVDYYVTRSANFFAINVTSTPTAGANYAFDYLVTQ